MLSAVNLGIEDSNKILIGNSVGREAQEGNKMAPTESVLFNTGNDGDYTAQGSWRSNGADNDWEDGGGYSAKHKVEGHFLLLRDEE